MITKIQKWGNSLAVRIPSAFSKELEVNDGARVEMSIADGKLVISPSYPKYSLDELLDKITEENLHQETDTGPAAGNEII